MDENRYYSTITDLLPSRCRIASSNGAVVGLFLLMCMLIIGLQSNKTLFSFLCLGSTSSSASDHWLVRLTGGSKRGSVVSGGPVPGSLGAVQAPESPELPVFRDEPPKTVETCRYLD